MDNWQHHCIDETGTEVPASAYIACNFPPSTKGPSLLKHDDVITLFHEMGHALHHMASKVDEAAVSGISGVEWDAVEFPSQFLENFAYEKGVLQLFARHHETGEVLPDAMIDTLIRAKNFQAGMGMVRQLEFSLFDMRVHHGPKSEGEVQDILEGIRKKTAIIRPPVYNRFQNGFSHIFSGGYAAGYYSYKWAEVLSADAYFAFADRGVFDRELADRFVQTVLALGGSQKAMETFKAFMGREPDPTALLRLYDIAA